MRNSSIPGPPDALLAPLQLRASDVGKPTYSGTALSMTTTDDIHLGLRHKGLGFKGLGFGVWGLGSVNMGG